MNILIEHLLNSVYCQKSPNATTFKQGMPEGQMFGIAYHYYLDESYTTKPEIHKFLRNNIAADITFSEGKKFCGELEKSSIPKIMAEKWITWRDKRSLAETVSAEEIELIQNAYISARQEFLRVKLYYFPLRNFSGEVFRGKSFSILDRGEAVRKNSLADNAKMYSDVSRWLCISSRSAEAAIENMEAVCGALSLAIHDQQRHTFVMSTPPGGHVSEGTLFPSSPRVVVPSIMETFEFTGEDAAWLSKLDAMTSNSNKSPHEVQALRFFYFSWLTSSQERFALECMAIDAIAPRKSHKSMYNKCKWIQKNGTYIPA